MSATDQGTATVDSVNAGSVSISHGPGTYRVAIFVDTRIVASTLSEWPLAEPMPPSVPSYVVGDDENKHLIVKWPVPDSGELSVYVWVGEQDSAPPAGVFYGPWYVQAPEPAPGPAVY